MFRRFVCVALVCTVTTFVLRPPVSAQGIKDFSPYYSRLNDPPNVYTIIHVGVSPTSNGTPYLVRVFFNRWGSGYKVQRGAAPIPTNPGTFGNGNVKSAGRGSSGGTALPDPDEHVFPDPWPGLDDLPDPDPWPEIPEPPLDDWDPELDLPGMDFPDPSDDTWFPTDLSDNDLTPWHFTPGPSSPGSPIAAPETPRAAPGAVNTGTKPAGIALSDDGKLLVVANSGSSNISLIAPSASPTAIGAISLPADSAPTGVALSHDGTRAYVTSSGSSPQLLVVDIPGRAVVAAVGVGALPVAAAVTPDGSQVWVSGNFGSSVTVIDTLTNTPIAAFTVPRAWGIAFNATGTRAYVASSTDVAGQIYVIDTTTYKTVAQVTVGDQPRQVVVTPSGRHVFCNNRQSGTISQIATATNTVIRTFNVGPDAEGIQLGK